MKMENETIIYTDGACSGNPGSGGWAAVILFPDGHLEELGGGEKNTTNNRMEISAAIAALEASRNAGIAGKIRIYTDSSLLLNGITKWIWGWLRRNWKTSQETDVANRDLWERLWRLVSPLRGKLEWIHVKGHAGHDVNERCDRIAVSYSKNAPLKLYKGPAIGCGYSLLPPEEEPDTDSVAKSAPRPKNEKDKFYISLVDGQFMRHNTWAECEKQVKGKRGARFKKVYSDEEARECLQEWQKK